MWFKLMACEPVVPESPDEHIIMAALKMPSRQTVLDSNKAQDARVSDSRVASGCLHANL